MSALVVYESMWGNTRAVAEAIARGLGPDTEVLDVTRASGDLPTEVDLLVIGGPTHAFSMSRGTTRHDAAQRGAPAGEESQGIREWLAGLEPPRTDAADLPGRDSSAPQPLAVATFDTRVAKVRRLPGSAAKAAAKEVRRRRLGHLVGTESFYVDDMAGPLLDGERERAEAWGEQLRRARAARRGDHAL
jgi:hypothetical protein